MELIDSAFPLLHDVIATTDLDTACAGVDVAVLVGGFPRGPGMERADLMAKNAPIFGPQGAALNQHASSDVKILVVANPANTNAWIVAQHAPNIPRRNITAMTRLDHNRARGKVADMLRVPNHTVQNVIIWGNHSSTQVGTYIHTYIHTYIKKKKKGVYHVTSHHITSHHITSHHITQPTQRRKTRRNSRPTRPSRSPRSPGYNPYKAL